MKHQNLHPWNVSSHEAVEIQKRLAPMVNLSDCMEDQPKYVAGVDISPPDGKGNTVGAAVVVELPKLQIVEVKVYQAEPLFPYVPGLLSFREAPLILGALELLTTTPDLILVDGQGLAHPRRFGLACHIGLFTDTPTIGCAKSILIGRPEVVLPSSAGSRVPLTDKGETVGAAVRTRQSVNPIYVSIGHKVSLQKAIDLTLACCKGYRMPEPTRLAHLAAAGRIPSKEPGQ